MATCPRAHLPFQECLGHHSPSLQVPSSCLGLWLDHKLLQPWQLWPVCTDQVGWAQLLPEVARPVPRLRLPLRVFPPTLQG